MYQSTQIKIWKLKTSKEELIDLGKAWAAISLAFGILIYSNQSANLEFWEIFMISVFTVGTGFLLHELAHKIVAQRYGCFAEFRSFDHMLILAIVFAFIGFIYAAPGAVFILGPVGKRRNGIISAAGPVTNLLIAGILLLLIQAFGNNPVFSYGLRINTWLALFNMIPFLNFDGQKIWAWSKTVYFLILIVSVGFMFM